MSTPSNDDSWVEEVLLQAANPVDLRRTYGDRYSEFIERNKDVPRIKDAAAEIRRRMVEAEVQRTLNAFTQLKQARINHTLSVHPDDWMREVDFIDMEMNRQLAELKQQGGE
jgi:hypothetical protein